MHTPSTQVLPPKQVVSAQSGDAMCEAVESRLDAGSAQLLAPKSRRVKTGRSNREQEPWFRASDEDHGS